jgi:hypothetical protein
MCDNMPDNGETVQKELTKQLKSAYRKFKTHSYYDTYGAINRAKIANFETKISLNAKDDFFKKLAEDLTDERKQKRLLRRCHEISAFYVILNQLNLNLMMNQH